VSLAASLAAAGKAEAIKANREQLVGTGPKMLLFRLSTGGCGCKPKEGIRRKLNKCSRTASNRKSEGTEQNPEEHLNTRKSQEGAVEKGNGAPGTGIGVKCGRV